MWSRQTGVLRERSRVELATRIGAGVVVPVVYLAVATATRLPLMWDGSYYLFRILDDGGPFVVYHRWAVAPLHIPTLLTGRMFGVELASYVFSFTYALVPVLIAGVAWWWHRRHPAALAWSLIGIVLSVLPGQVFFVAEAVIAVQLWWPLLMLAASGRLHQHRWSAIGVTVLILVLHPASALLLVAVAGAITLRPDSSRGILIAAGVLVASAAARYLTLSGYEQATRPTVLGMVNVGGVALTAAYVLAGAAVLLAAARSFWTGRDSVTMRRATWACAGAGAVVYLAAALDPEALAGGLIARKALAVVVIPLGVIAAVHVARRGDAPCLPLARVAAAGAVLMALFTAGAGFTWNRLVDTELRPLLAGSSQCVALEDVDRFQGTPLDHWSTASLAIVLQGRAPGTLVLGYGGCSQPGGAVTLLDAPHGGPRERNVGWFDLTGAGLS